MRVVLDTGILIAALITTDTPPSLLYQASRKKRFDLVPSEWQLDEFRRDSRYSKLRRFLKPVEAGSLVNGLRRQAKTRPALSPRGSLSKYYACELPWTSSLVEWLDHGCF
jgi:predicted nucleic acid-binding protein